MSLTFKRCGTLNENGPLRLIGSGILEGVALLELVWPWRIVSLRVGFEVSEALATPMSLSSCGLLIQM